MSVRSRRPQDDDAIAALNDAAFGGSYESRLVSDLRAAGLAAIELVTTKEEAIVGHILFSVLSLTVEQGDVRALALAPMAVAPARQRQGIGSTLVRAGLEQARQDRWHAIIVLGHPRFYPRFGFTPELAARLDAPFHGEAFMALELVAGALTGRGRVVYPPAFGL